ncbi:helix-turn-helix domain-containing protein [Paenibacillus lignilyticus]|uniref:Helix-turn-helix transcriptional regulator n=1 Tax=Paenibacillus lignilyticus TaxID=1172615 RepID=A0ABS5C9L6_9BACL|nr:AraC family transcriptional regulator [Paenibacillus lignilyticus]MBP3962687.1 helix-turn-helix transcriptional regulator [Paenibacillus lignilyticus]
MMNSFEIVGTPSEFARSHLFFGLIGGYDAPRKDFLYTRDYYPAYEILFITKGKGAFKHANQWIEIVEGDCVVHDMRMPHAYKTEAKDAFEMYYLVFDSIDMEHFWPKLFGEPSYSIVQNLPAVNEIRSLLEQIAELMSEQHPAYEMPLSAHIYQLLMEIFRKQRDLGGSWLTSQGTEPEPLQRARAYMDANYLEVEEVSQLAQIANLSLYHFIRQFKKQYGVTPKEYVLLKKVHHAKRLLISTSLSIGEVSMQSGFASYNAFLHAFLKVQHDSPRDFRRSLRRL